HLPIRAVQAPSVTRATPCAQRIAVIARVSVTREPVAVHRTHPIRRHQPLPAILATITQQHAEPRQLLRRQRNTLTRKNKPRRATTPLAIRPPERPEQPRLQPRRYISHTLGEHPQSHIRARVRILKHPPPRLE